ncbi:hypothetical protein ACFQJC_17740 [Haloferax namakaokahaiae]|uniref:Sulfatase n=1 Tax=Haloferax namakaokahaiae TaxID=1748331 RepID=A0ABD5ZJF3_9EURY
MYTFSQIRKGVSLGRTNPAFFGREFNRLYYSRLNQREFNQEGIDVVAEDWDNLLILDACRYDLFAEHSTLPGRLESRQSRGSHTVEFLRGNFTDRDLQDTVYVSASPQLYAERDRLRATFHDVIHVWSEEGWDQTHGTVLPETMAEYALRASEAYPEKRIIVHFMQPHYPFIGSPELNARSPFESKDKKLDIWAELMTRKRTVDPEVVWEAYRDNLLLALPVVEELMQSLPGRTVVTSDHGNMIGERSFPVPIREWGHPPGIYTKELVTVPWLVFDNGQRRTITSGSPVDVDEGISSDVVTDRLANLGYVE